MKPRLQPADPAFPVMTLDLISHLLGRADHPGELAHYLADEIRELTGARGILLTQCGQAADGSECRVLCLEPAPLRLRAEGGPELSVLIRAAHQLRGPSVWPAGEGELRPALAALGLDLALAFPLNAGRFRVGSMVVLGLPDPNRLEEVRDLLETLTGIVALVLRNAGLYQDQERLIAERTRAWHEMSQFNDQIIRNAQEGIIVYGRDLRYQAWNPFMERLTGLAANEVLGKHPLELFPFLREAGVLERLEEALAGEVPAPREFRHHMPHLGKSGWVSDACAPFRNAQGEIVGVIATVRDVTERKEAEATVQASLREKESLLKEIHHRVKNNLQIISSLLRMQAGRIDHPLAQAALQDMQSRVRSMALIHEHLYRSENLAQVDLATYLKHLCHQLLRTLVARPGAIQLHLELVPIRLEIDQAIPCGLLVNELVSNAFKHAFPEERPGEVRVELQPVAGGAGVRLRVADNGVGLPVDFDPERLTSLGLRLVTDLACQIGGRLERGAGPGTVFEVTFSVKS